VRIAHPRTLDVDSFKTIVEKRLENVPDVDWGSRFGMDALAEDLEDAIWEGIRGSCKRFSGQDKVGNLWWDKELADHRRELRRLAKKKGRSPQDQVLFSECRFNYRQLISEKREKAWQATCNELNDMSSISRIVKSLRDETGQEVGLVKGADGNLPCGPLHSIRNLCDAHFPENQYLQGKDNNFYDHCYKHVKRRVRLPADTRVPECRDLVEALSPEKVKGSFMSFQPFKAAGFDGIQPVFLHHLPEVAYLLISKLFLATVAMRYTPPSWSRARVVFIPKQAKSDYSQAGSFRPITLSSFIFKGLEKCMDSYLESKLKLPLLNQHGFTRGRCVESALSEVVHTIEKSLENKKFTLGVLMDIKGAFDNVSFDTIVAALRKHNITDDFVLWYEHYLRSRKVRCEQGSVRHAFSPGRGTPQGGVLSPKMWNLCMDGLLTSIAPLPTKCIGLADDAMILSTGIDERTVIETAQETVNRALAWGDGCGLVFSCAKTQVIMFTRKQNRSRLKDPPKIVVNSNEIEYSPTVKYLGIQLHYKLSWNTHIDSICKKSKRSLMSLRALIG